jgi:hypothetical protein
MPPVIIHGNKKVQFIFEQFLTRLSAAMRPLFGFCIEKGLPSKFPNPGLIVRMKIREPSF